MALTPCVKLQISSMVQGYHKYQHIWEVTLAAIMADEDSNEGSGPQGCGKYCIMTFQSKIHKIPNCAIK